MLCAKFGWNWRSSSGEEDENVESIQTDGRTFDGQQAIRKAHLSYQLKQQISSVLNVQEMFLSYS